MRLIRWMLTTTLMGGLLWLGTPGYAADDTVFAKEESTSWWSSLKATFNTMTQWFLPTSPTQVARQIRAGDSVFWKLLADAGYELEEVQSTAAWLPEVVVWLRLTRELSDADREWVERRVDEQLPDDGTLTEGLQRAVLLMLLETSITSDRIERLQLVLEPFPRAQLILRPLPPPEKISPPVAPPAPPSRPAAQPPSRPVARHGSGVETGKP